MRIIGIIVALVLAGCGLATSYQIANMTPGQLTKLSDADLCGPYTGNSPAIMAERQKRDLEDCKAQHLYCRSLDLQNGTDAYVNCRLQAAQIAAQQEAARPAGYAAMTRQGAAMMSRRQSPAPTAAPSATRSTARACSISLDATRSERALELRRRAGIS